MKEKKIKALKIIKGKLMQLSLPEIVYFLGFDPLFFEGIFKKNEEEKFWEELRKQDVVEIESIHEGGTLVGRKLKFNCSKLTEYKNKIIEEYLGDIVDFRRGTRAKKYIIKENILALISESLHKIDYLKSPVLLKDFLVGCGVDKRLLLGYKGENKKSSNISELLEEYDIYPHIVINGETLLRAISNPAPRPDFSDINPFQLKVSKHGKIFEVLSYYSFSLNQDKRTLFKIIENSVSPLIHSGDEKKAEKHNNKLNKYLQYDGYVIKDGKVTQMEDFDYKIGLKTKEVKGVGYLVVKIKEEGLVEIGRVKTAKFQFIKCLLKNGYGKVYSIDEVYLSIEKHKTGLGSNNEKIRSTISEIQRKKWGKEDGINMILAKKYRFKLDFPIKNKKIGLECKKLATL